jgi:phosphatidylglycerophosphate synthase
MRNGSCASFRDLAPDMASSRTQLVATVVWIVGALLFAATLFYVDVSIIAANLGQLARAMPGVLVVSGAWHLLRTLAWSHCFEASARPPFRRLLRVRLAAEAFSFVTIRGVAGEPLKVLLLAEVRPTDAAAAVALERISYVIVTTLILGGAAAAALLGLPLSPGWLRIFEVISIAAAVVLGIAAVIVAGRGYYLAPVVMWVVRATGRTQPSIVGRFVLAIERQLLHLVRTSGRRLGVLLAIQSGCYATMAMEIWILLRAVGAPITINGAMAIETFTRATSFMSAFIPGNLGALEASNAAAVTAVGAAAAGGVLALGRRLRGLWWAAVGFVVYPRRVTRAPASREGPDIAVISDDPDNDVSPWDRLAALPIAERVFRAASAGGYRRVFVWATTDAERLATCARRAAPHLDVVVTGDRERWRDLFSASGTRALTVLGPATVVSTAFLKVAAEVGPLTDTIRELPAGSEWPSSGVFRATPAQIADVDALRAFIRACRREAGPGPTGVDVSKGSALLTIRPTSRADLPAAEETIRRATYKSTDPFLARFNRRMSLPISMWLLRTPLTANGLSLLLVGLGFYAAWLFSQGTYLTILSGAIVSLAASILDGCDGEIARLKYQESAFGCWLETFGDYSYYVAIFIGMTLGAVKYTRAPVFYEIGGAALAGSLITFGLLIFLRQRITSGRPERLQAAAKAHFYASGSKWAWFVAKIAVSGTRSSMPYGILAFSVLGLLPVIVVLAMIGANAYWMSLLIKLPGLVTSSGEQPVTDGPQTG